MLRGWCKRDTLHGVEELQTRCGEVNQSQVKYSVVYYEGLNKWQISEKFD